MQLRKSGLAALLISHDGVSERHAEEENDKPSDIGLPYADFPLQPISATCIVAAGQLDYYSIKHINITMPSSFREKG